MTREMRGAVERAGVKWLVEAEIPQVMVFHCVNLSCY